MEKRFVDKPWRRRRRRRTPVGAFKFPLRTLLIYIIKPRRIYIYMYTYARRYTHTHT